MHICSLHSEISGIRGRHMINTVRHVSYVRQWWTGLRIATGWILVHWKFALISGWLTKGNKSFWGTSPLSSWERTKDDSDDSIPSDAHYGPMSDWRKHQARLRSSHSQRWLMWVAGEAGDVLGLLCDRWRHASHTGCSWKQLSERYLNLTFSHLLGESLEHMFERG